MIKRVIIAVICLFVVLLLIRFSQERHRSASVNCISLLRDIDAAKQNWALDRNKTTNDTPNWDDLVPHYIRDKPTCPEGGVYIIGKVGELPRCSYPGHKLK